MSQKNQTNSSSKLSGNLDLFQIKLILWEGDKKNLIKVILPADDVQEIKSKTSYFPDTKILCPIMNLSFKTL
jgi:hypothetical protein